MFLKVPKFIVRRQSYNKIMKINEEINAITKNQKTYDILEISKLETKKSLYIEKYNNTLKK